MNPTRSFLYCAAVVLSSCLAVSGQTTPTPAPSATTLAAINAYTTDIDRFIKQTKRHRIFGDASSEEDDNSVWKEFKSVKEVEKCDTCYQSAYVYTRRKKVVATNFSFTSPSGDWVHFVNYYFREDGTLAKIAATLNTFYGEVSIVRSRYYDSNGRLIKSTQEFLDLHTRKPRKPVEFMDEEIPVFLKVSALPFHQFL